MENRDELYVFLRNSARLVKKNRVSTWICSMKKTLKRLSRSLISSMILRSTSLECQQKSKLRLSMHYNNTSMKYWRVMPTSLR
jgi:hypothetical protein